MDLLKEKEKVLKEKEETGLMSFMLLTYGESVQVAKDLLSLTTLLMWTELTFAQTTSMANQEKATAK